MISAVSSSPITEKRCSTCKEKKPTTGFWLSSNNSDGFRGKCIPCEMQYRQDRKHLDREASNEAQRKRREAAREKVREAARQWAEANPEKVLEEQQKRLKTLAINKLEQSRRWRREHPEKVRESQRKYREAHPEIYREATKKYYKANPEIKRASERKRKAAKHKNSTFYISPKELKNLYSRPCSYCNGMGEITLDHVVPISRGGVHGIGNLVPACGPCNFSKGQKLLIEWKIYKNRKGK